MKYCSQCASPVEFRVPDGDNRPRHICPECDTIFYLNPRIVAGAVPVFSGKEGTQVLLCKRAIEPRKGFWTLPAGFMENGESTEQAAKRETHEEANAVVKINSLFTMVSVPHINQVHLFYLADLAKAEFAAGDESQEVALFTEQDIPWQQLAFPTVARTLKRFFKHRDNPEILAQCESSVIELNEALKKLEAEEIERQKSSSRQTS